MRYGYWLPVFGGWLRNVRDEGMEPTWDYVRRLAQRSERSGYDLTLIAELFLNDIKGIEAPSLDAWSTAAALAAVTDRLELMVAVRPTFHNPAILAKQAANVDRISNGRLALNVVSSWWKDEARRYGVRFDEHDERYARTAEWLAVVDGVWREPTFSFDGRFYRVEETVAQPKPVRTPRPTIYAGGESDAAKDLIARTCDAYVMHGDPPERIATRIDDLRRRRDALHLPPMQFGVAAYAVVRADERRARAEVERITNVAPGSPGYRQLPGLGRQYEARAATQPGGLFGFQPWVARRPGRHAGAGGGTRARILGGRRGSAAAAVQSTGRGDGPVRGGGHAARGRKRSGGRVSGSRTAADGASGAEVRPATATCRYGSLRPPRPLRCEPQFLHRPGVPVGGVQNPAAPRACAPRSREKNAALNTARNVPCGWPRHSGWNANSTT